MPKIEVDVEEYVRLLKMEHEDEVRELNREIDEKQSGSTKLLLTTCPCLKCGGGHAMGRVEWGRKDMVGVCNKCGQKHSVAKVE